MPKYTRRNYISIGNLIKKLPKKERTKQYKTWNREFKKDNPLYSSKRFKKYIGLK